MSQDGRMSESSNPLGAGTVTFTTFEGERRRTDRVELSHPVRVRPSNPQDGNFDEVCTTLNASRDGLYFSTERTEYRAGLSVLVTFPYSAVPGARNVEFVGQVVRVDQLANGRLGVAVDLLTTVLLKRREHPLNVD